MVGFKPLKKVKMEYQKHDQQLRGIGVGFFIIKYLVWIGMRCGIVKRSFCDTSEGWIVGFF